MLKDHQRAVAEPEAEVEIDLRDPAVAAFWAWVWPGAGHFYQRRYAKGLLFMICVLVPYFYGLFALGGGHVVYASWKPGDRRWQYVCQLGVGAAALPALVQSYRVNNDREPLLGGILAPPRDFRPNVHDELASWHFKLGSGFELGTLFTVVAGLLNVLAIYDAYGGPFMPARPRPDDDKDKPPPEGSDKKT